MSPDPLLASGVWAQDYPRAAHQRVCEMEGEGLGAFIRDKRLSKCWSPKHTWKLKLAPHSGLKMTISPGTSLSVFAYC